MTLSEAIRRLEEDFPEIASGPSSPAEQQEKTRFQHEILNLVKREMRKLKPESIASVLELVTAFAQNLMG